MAKNMSYEVTVSESEWTFVRLMNTMSHKRFEGISSSLAQTSQKHPSGHGSGSQMLTYSNIFRFFL